MSHIPRGRATQRFASFAVYGIAPAAFVGLWWLQAAGLTAPTSLWIVAGVLGASSAVNLVTSLLVARCPASEWAVQTRVIAAAIGTALPIYAVGWGSLLTIAYAIGAAELLRTIGPAAARSTMIWHCAAIAVAEVAVEFGLAPSVVDAELSHVIALSGGAIFILIVQVLARSARAIESAEEMVRERALHFEALIEHASDLIGVVSVDGVVLSVSPAVTPMLGYHPDDVAGHPISEFVRADQAVGIEPALQFAASTVGVPHSREIHLRHADGSHRLVVATLTTPRTGRPDHIVLNVHDVTLQRELEVRLRHDARHDSLTGLLNRKAFGEASEGACRRAARSGATVGMLYIDLDGFKQINDTFGHDAGDRVLVEAGQRLRHCLNPGETLARLGGDEFAVLIDDAGADRPVALAERVLDALGEPIRGLPDDVRVGASIGIALRSSDGIEYSSLMQDADAAMYIAKRKGRARWEMTQSVTDGTGSTPMW